MGPFDLPVNVLPWSSRSHGEDELVPHVGLDNPAKHGLQTSADGKFSVEFAECLASCGTGPVMMCNDDFYEAVSSDEADKIMEGCE